MLPVETDCELGDWSIITMDSVSAAARCSGVNLTRRGRPGAVLQRPRQSSPIRQGACMVKVALNNASGEESPESKPRPTKAPRKSHWLMKLMFLTAVAVAAAPSVISMSGQGPTILKKLQPKIGQAVSFQKLQVHWWTPVEITGLSIRDLSSVSKDQSAAEAPLMCEIEKTTTTEPLWRIVLNAGRGTGLVLKSPHVRLIADDNGTNIDRTLTELFGESDTAKTTKRFPFRITIEDGTVELKSGSNLLNAAPTLTTKDSAESSPEIAALVSSINGYFSTMDTERWLPEMKVTAEINRQSDDAVAKRGMNGDKTTPRPTRLAAGLDDVVSDFPEVPLDGLAGTDDSGDATGARIQIHLKPRADEKGRQTIQIGARDVDLRLVQPFLSMLNLDASCSGVISGGIDARLAGANLTEGIVGRILLHGETIRIRQQAWATNEWLNLGTVNAGGALAMAEDGILIQDLNFKSDILELDGSGELRHNVSESEQNSSSQQVEVKGAVDIARLTSSLRETLAIHQDVQIQSGRVTFGLKASAKPGEETALNATDNDSLIRPVSLTRNEAQLGQWQLMVKTEDLAAIRAGQPLRVDSSLRVDAVGSFVESLPELLRARVTAGFGTIDLAPDKSAWKVSGNVQPAALWQQLQQFADIPQPGLQGDVSFQSRIAMLGETIQLTDLQVNSSDVKASSSALEITPSNPVTAMLDGTVHVEGTGAALKTLLAPWHDASWLSDRANVISDLTATPTREIELAVRITPENVANLQRTNVLSVSRPQPRSSAVSHSSQAESSFAIDEADVQLSMLAKNAGQQFDIRKGSIKLPGLLALIQGTVSVPDEDLILDLTADTTYDLDILSRRLLTPDSGITISGQGKDVFRLTGSPSALSGVSQRTVAASGSSAPLLKGSGNVAWASANAWGLQIGEANVQASLENSLLRSTPIQCSVNGGQLNIMPQYDLAGSQLQLGTGSRVQNLQLTPELCRTWLGYVAPMLADTAEVNGTVSARVERFLWDFNAPENSDVQAQLTIHQAEASPGSSLSSLLEVVDLLRRSGDASQSLTQRSLVLPEQTIPVQVRQGYVAHDGLVMDLNGYRMRTSGAVGLNKQLQMTIDVPLEKSTADGAGRSIKVPLRGTISSPQPDTGALLQNLGTQKIQEKLGDQVDKTLNKQLNKLFDKF